MTKEKYAELVDTEWPDCNIALTYVDKETGELRAMTNEEYEEWRAKSDKEWEEAEFNQEPESKE